MLMLFKSALHWWDAKRGQAPDVLEMFGLGKCNQTVDALYKEAICNELEVLAHDAFDQLKRKAHDFF